MAVRVASLDAVSVRSNEELWSLGVLPSVALRAVLAEIMFESLDTEVPVPLVACDSFVEVVVSAGPASPSL